MVLLSIYKSGNMFRLIEPIHKRIEGTFSRCAHCGIPNVYKSLSIEVDIRTTLHDLGS